MAIEARTETVTLNGPTVVHEVMRYPVEGPLLVSKSEENRLRAASKLIDDVDEDDDVPEDLKGKKVADLKAIALKEGAPLNDATKAKDIVAAIVAHRAKEA